MKGCFEGESSKLVSNKKIKVLTQYNFVEFYIKNSLCEVEYYPVEYTRISTINALQI